MAEEIYTFDEEGMRKLVAAFRDNQRELQNLRRHLAHFSTRRHQTVYVPAAKIHVHNNSGEEIPAYAVMKVTGVDESGAKDVYEVEKPDNSFEVRYLVNLSSPIPINGNGFGTWLDKSDRVLYNNSSGTPVVDQEWGAKASQWSLEKNRPGFVISGGNETVDGASVVRAKQHLVTDLIGKADSDISKGSTGTVSIWMGASGSEAVTEYDLECSALGAAVTGSKWAVVFWRNGVWYVGPWEC